MLSLYQQKLELPLILGTALYPSIDVMCDAITASQTPMVTVSLKRQGEHARGNVFFEKIKSLGCAVLPNTAGCRNAEDAILTAKMGREIFKTSLIKLEVIQDDLSLAPHSVELIKAAKVLVDQGFDVLPYCSEDLSVATALVVAGCKVLMPWAAPIGSGQGLQNPRGLSLLRERFSDVSLIIDAGLGTASDASKVMEMGFDGVLLNSAVALAHDPVQMANAFRLAVQAGSIAFQAKRMPRRDFAKASTPLQDTAFWLQDKV